MHTYVKYQIEREKKWRWACSFDLARTKTKNISLRIIHYINNIHTLDEHTLGLRIIYVVKMKTPTNRKRLRVRLFRFSEHDNGTLYGILEQPARLSVI